MVLANSLVMASRFFTIGCLDKAVNRVKQPGQQLYLRRAPTSPVVTGICEHSYRQLNRN
jgi:hypothetical protein